MLFYYTLILVFAPLLGSLVAGLLAKRIGCKGAHSVTIFLMLVSFACACKIFVSVVVGGATLNQLLYHWAISGSFQFDIGFFLDNLTAVMLMVVTFVSTLVHIYSIGYMKGDPGYQRFFCYMSLFTFCMLMLVTSNNFLQLFFGWEGVGLVSYLLIGFYFTKPSAADGSLKAFIVNRIGDFGLILGLSAVIATFGTVDYMAVFSAAPQHATQTLSIFGHIHWSLMTVICVLLFVGAMGKSAQIPLHVWLPESMEGPTPISALIHAATMVTAGVFMVARMSPLFEFSEAAMSLVLVIGASGALFLGILAFVENDIKRVIAYSTMSQLGYMMAGNGASAFGAGIFHLSTHGCFKALLFLCAGSVIVAMHHEQDLRKMGGLRKYLPVTYVCFFIGAAALAALPPFAGFYSKDAIIEAVHLSTIPGATYSYWCVLFGAFVTGFYIFRAFFMAFHGPERFDASLRAHLKEHWAMRIAMIGLAIPATFLGMLFVKQMVYEQPGLLGDSVTIFPQYNVLKIMAEHFHGVWSLTWHAIFTAPFWLSLSGVFFAWLTASSSEKWWFLLLERFDWLRRILLQRYWFDAFNEVVIVKPAMKISQFFYAVTDLIIIDDYCVNGSGRRTVWLSNILRRFQTGFIYHYVFVMIVCILAFLIWMVFF
ncbi:MAG: NADH-quinone oxidoreductase subunit L [Legionellales bacterium]|nr:NADH-quinone oxidoreductase subunit L [Legionellales bacterium]HAG61941.1 NADH-quinone oxidoreductase subunit L [Coxiellaceae bacterium]